MRFLTDDQKALLRNAGIRANLLVTFYFDEGTVRFCDHIDNLTDGTNTWVGASVLFAAADITGSGPLAAEGVTIKLDGNRLFDAGVTDPGVVLSALFTTQFQQRRVDLDYSFSELDSELIQLIQPAYAGKINYATLNQAAFDDLDVSQPVFDTLDIVLDSLALRYQRPSGRVRSHDDQLEIDPTDLFFQYTAMMPDAEQTLYWGKAVPTGIASTTAVGVITHYTPNPFQLFQQFGPL